MHRFPLAAALAFSLAGLLPAAEAGPRPGAAWFNASTPEGWTGKQYADGGEVFAEEFDSNHDGRVDIWRFYARGLLSSEERDVNHDGKVDYQSRWDAPNRRLVLLLRDSRFQGTNDLEIEALSARRWEIREDRNHDGVTDRVLIADGPPDLFERLKIDLYRQPDIIDSIPREYWNELHSDDGFSGGITDYRRYAKGRPTHFGAWEKGKLVWRRSPSGSGPPPAQPPPRAAFTPPPPHGPNCPIPNCPEPYCRVEPSNAPIDDLPAPAPIIREPGGGYVSAPQVPAPADRTRYDGMPPGESAARSLPARMRPPGVGPR